MTWDDVAKSYANLGWVGEGEGEIAEIAVIARDRKSKSSPRRRGEKEPKDRTQQE